MYNVSYLAIGLEHFLHDRKEGTSSVKAAAGNFHIRPTFLGCYSSLSKRDITRARSWLSPVHHSKCCDAKLNSIVEARKKTFQESAQHKSTAPLFDLWTLGNKAQLSQPGTDFRSRFLFCRPVFAYTNYLEKKYGTGEMWKYLFRCTVQTGRYLAVSFQDTFACFQ